MSASERQINFLSHVSIIRELLEYQTYILIVPFIPLPIPE